MASSKEYIEFVLDQCNGLSARAMMGEYVLYYGGRKAYLLWNKRDMGELRGIAKCTFLSHIFFVGQFSDGLPVYKTPPA